MFELDDVEPDNPLRQRLLEMESRWRSFLTELTAEAVATGGLKADLNIEQFVWELCGIYLNHHVSYRFVKDPQATERALKAWSVLVAHAKPEKRQAKTRVTRSSIG